MSSMHSLSNRDESAAATPSPREAFLERQMEECGEAYLDFNRAVLLLVKHGAARETLIEQLDEVIERGW